jgi:predicted Zn-dependent protease
MRKKIERYRKRNPYYLIRQAQIAMDDGRFEEAVRLARAAIGRLDDEAHFYHVLAQAQAHLKRWRACKASLEKAARFAADEATRSRYARKLELLAG